MPKTNFNITPANLKKIHKALKKHEKENNHFLIGSEKLSDFLVSNVTFSIEGYTIELVIKQYILKVVGEFAVKPENLLDNTLLKDNLNYGDYEFFMLKRELENYLKKINKIETILPNSDFGKCKSVADVIKLVKSKVKSND
jgi:hypothetical protein